MICYLSGKWPLIIYILLSIVLLRPVGIRGSICVLLASVINRFPLAWERNEFSRETGETGTEKAAATSTCPFGSWSEQAPPLRLIFRPRSSPLVNRLSNAELSREGLEWLEVSAYQSGARTNDVSPLMFAQMSVPWLLAALVTFQILNS